MRELQRFSQKKMRLNLRGKFIAYVVNYYICR